jgi:hypothetical protein
MSCEPGVRSTVVLGNQIRRLTAPRRRTNVGEPLTRLHQWTLTVQAKPGHDFLEPDAAVGP